LEPVFQVEPFSNPPLGKTLALALKAETAIAPANRLAAAVLGKGLFSKEVKEVMSKGELK